MSRHESPQPFRTQNTRRIAQRTHFHLHSIHTYTHSSYSTSDKTLPIPANLNPDTPNIYLIRILPRPGTLRWPWGLLPQKRKEQHFVLPRSCAVNCAAHKKFRRPSEQKKT